MGGMVAPVTGSLVSFLVGLLVGGLAIHISASVIVGYSSYRTAIVTAAIGAFAWFLVSLLVGWIPVLGGPLAGLVALIVYVGVINTQYPGGWRKATAVAFVAWLAALLVMFVLGAVGLDLPIVGVPGV